MYNTILLAYDGSDHARHALAHAVTLARTFSSDLHMVHTLQIDTPHIVVGAFVAPLERPPTEAQVREAGQHLETDAKARVSAEGYALSQTHIGRGDPAEFTLETAKNLNADLIVMGRRGLGAVKSLVLGSVSQSVAHGASCDVLTVA